MKQMTIATLGMILTVVLSVSFAWAGGKVTGAEARSLVEQGANLLDVRTDREFRKGHIEGAMHIPVQELAERINEIEDKEKEIVLYCRTGRRSAQAATMLREAGFDKVYDLGGMGNWE